MNTISSDRLSEIRILFKKLRDRGIFWSYRSDISYEDLGNSIFIEHLLKYGDYDDLCRAFVLFDTELIHDIWSKTVAPDKRFLRANLLIARVFLNLDVESDFFRDLTYDRNKKLRQAASGSSTVAV